MDIQELDVIKRRVLDRLLTRGGPHLSDELRAYAAVKGTSRYSQRAARTWTPGLRVSGKRQWAIISRP
jgi:hypothetical protein